MNEPEGRECKRRLAALGFEADFDEFEARDDTSACARNLPDAFVIDLSRLPSPGRQVGMGMRTRKSTRTVPIVFVDGDPEKVAQLKTLLPDATYTTWPRLKTALARAIGKPPKAPIVPPSSIYTGKTDGRKARGQGRDACRDARRAEGIRRRRSTRCRRR